MERSKAFRRQQVAKKKRKVAKRKPTLTPKERGVEATTPARKPKPKQKGKLVKELRAPESEWDKDSLQE